MRNIGAMGEVTIELALVDWRLSHFIVGRNIRGKFREVRGRHGASFGAKYLGYVRAGFWVEDNG